MDCRILGCISYIIVQDLLSRVARLEKPTLSEGTCTLYAHMPYGMKPLIQYQSGSSSYTCSLCAATLLDITMSIKSERQASQQQINLYTLPKHGITFTHTACALCWFET